MTRPRSAFKKQPSNCADANARIGTVAILNADGTLVRQVQKQGIVPSNLTFGGADGKTVFVTQTDGGFVETFRADDPGREPCMQFGGAFC